MLLGSALAGKRVSSSGDNFFPLRIDLIFNWHFARKANIVSQKVFSFENKWNKKLGLSPVQLNWHGTHVYFTVDADRLQRENEIMRQQLKAMEAQMAELLKQKR